MVSFSGGMVSFSKRMDETLGEWMKTHTEWMETKVDWMKTHIQWMKISVFNLKKNAFPKKSEMRFFISQERTHDTVRNRIVLIQLLSMYLLLHTQMSEQMLVHSNKTQCPPAHTE